MSELRPNRRQDRKPDKPYLAWLHTRECAALFCRRESPCKGPITAHHAGDHGFGQKPPDSTAIPLCDAHHQNGPHAIHGKLGKNWWAFFRLDRDLLIADLQAEFEKK